MGRIKTTAIKRFAERLIKIYPDKFGKNFEINKEVLKEITDIKSKKLRNIIAGYITRKMREQQTYSLNSK